MANIYVRSTDGSNTDNGTTWALAKLDLSGAAAIDAAGDNVYLSQVHAESTATAVSLDFAGTVGNPTKIVCVNDGAAPPTAVAITATVTTTGASDLYIHGNLYCYGVTFVCGTVGTRILRLGDYATTNNQIYQNCSFQLGSGAGAGSRIYLAGHGSSLPADSIVWKNCSVSFSNASQAISPYGAALIWEGGSVLSGSTALTTALFDGQTFSRYGDIYVRDVDLSNMGASCNLVNLASLNAQAVFHSCKLPASWSGAPSTGLASAGCRISVYNCDSGNTNYKLAIDDYAGTIRQETTLVKTGGATDGTTPIAWKMVTTSSVNEYDNYLRSDWMAVWIDTTGSSKTITVDILHDSATALTDAECWIEVSYLGSASTPLGTATSDKRADVLTTAAAQTSSSATWTTTGMSNPNKQKLEVTFTPQQKGFVSARVCIGKASKTVYVDCEPLVS